MYTRTLDMIGQEAFSRLQSMRVILFGIGGVGGWCAESLIRSGLGHLTIVDFDTVSSSNINRQTVATPAQVGRPKTEVAYEHFHAINPDADIRIINHKYGEDDYDFGLSTYDFVIDAIDTLDCKMRLIHEATSLSVPFISSMGAARRMDPTRVRVAEFWKVEGCPLARSLRTRMKKEGLMPLRPFLCVYTAEPPMASSGSMAPVVMAFGATLASLVISSSLNSKL